MTAREARFGLIAFSLLAVGLAVNLLALQSPGQAGAQKARGDRSALASAEKSDKARRLALPVAVGEAGRISAAVATAAGPSDTEIVRAIQRELQARGYETGGSDGAPGLMTRAAIMAYEHDHGLPLSAEPDEETLKRILLGGAGSAEASVPPRPERRAGAEAVIRTVQQTLSGLGYNTGKVDGRLGEDTQRAIREFEIDQQMPESGRISGRLIARLGKAAGGGRLPGAR